MKCKKPPQIRTGGKSESKQKLVKERSAAQSEGLDQRRVAFVILAAQVLEQSTAGMNHFHQTVARMPILGMRLEMLHYLIDPGGQQRDLHLGRADIVRRTLVFSDNLRLFCRRK